MIIRRSGNLFACLIGSFSLGNMLMFQRLLFLTWSGPSLCHFHRIRLPATELQPYSDTRGVRCRDFSACVEALVFRFHICAADERSRQRSDKFLIQTEIPLTHPVSLKQILILTCRIPNLLASSTSFIRRIIASAISPFQARQRFCFQMRVDMRCTGAQFGGNHGLTHH